jgi:hypothetical protein
MDIDLLSGKGLPHLRRAITVISTGGDVSPIWRPGDAAHKASMAMIANDAATCERIPNLYNASGITRGDICSVSRRPGCGKDIFVVTTIDK